MKSKFGKKKQSGPETGKESGIKDLHDLAHLEAREQVRWLSRAVESLRDAIYITGFDHNIIYANPAIEFVHGYKPEEVIGKKASYFFEGIPGNPPDLASLIKKEARDGFWTGEVLNRKKDGAIFPVQLIVNTIFGKKGEVLGYIGISRDITERKRAEEETIKLLKTIEIAKEAINIASDEGVMIYTNNAMEKLFGYQKGELIGKHVSILNVSPTPGAVVKRIMDEIKKKGYWEGEIQNKRKNGTEFISYAATSALKDKNGKILNFISTQHDITERKKAEDRIRESEEKFRTLAEESPNMIFINQKGRIVYANEKCKEIMGYKMEELYSPDFDFRTFIAPESIDLIEKNLSRHMRGEDVLPYDYTLITKEGKRIEVIMAPRLIKYGGEKAILGIITDITERNRMEKELLKTQKLESVGTLAGGIAHDFNNILMVILGNISFSKLGVDPTSEAFKFLSKAETACGRAKNLTQQLLTFSKGGIPVKKIASISGLLKEAASFALHGTNVRCEFLIADDLRPVEADEGQISQVINNLVINANQAMPEGGTIKLKAENINLKRQQIPPLEKGKYIKISIEDRGIGIPSKHISKIFDPFFSTKKKGSGLGLATAYSIVKNHNGTITAESQVGKGATFFIYLPASEKETAEKEELEKEITLGRGRILIMDDEEPVRDIIARLLTLIGYETECTREGAETVDIYKKAKETGMPFDAVILDLTVAGGMGGKETLKNLMKIDPEVKAIVSSGYSTDPIMSEFREYGFRGGVVKPFKVKELSEVLHKVLKNKNPE